MRSDIASVKDDIAEFKAEVNERFDALEYSLKKAWEDIEIGEAALKRHVAELHPR